MKNGYSAPSFEDLGSFEMLTKAAVKGGNLDSAFPTDTPFADLTFS